MLGTALAQLRFAASLTFGRPFSAWSLDWLIEATAATRREFGAVGSEAAELFGGPALDEETRRRVQLRRFRTQAVRAARDTAYYARTFDDLGLDPARLRYEDIARIPPTPKGALRANPDAFVRRGAKPFLRTMTTGTTGTATSVYFSGDELRTLVALGTIGFLTRGQIEPEDVVHISASARALGTLGFAGACARIGAVAYFAGLVAPERALALLAEARRIPGKKARANVLMPYPSYLGELVECGLRLGYRPADFGVERIFTGGELVTQGLKERALRLFGQVRFIENYGMTETQPFGGEPCSQGHLHFEAAQGLLEVLNPHTAAPARPGEAGTIVATPLPPFRETTVLLRYDTEDLVRPVPDPRGCSLARCPVATSSILGKLALAVRHDAGWTFPRDVVEALEAVQDVPLPARYGFWAAPGGVEVEVVARRDAPQVRRVVQGRLEERGVPVRGLHLVGEPGQLRRPVPLRCDLRELSFAPTDAGPVTVRGG